MDNSIFLAKLLGVYLIVAGITMFVQPNRIKMSFTNFVQSSGLVITAGAFTLLFGLFLVISHNFWVPDWRGLITVLCWMTLAKGIMLFAFPQFYTKLGPKLSQSHVGYYISSTLILFVGFFLSYHGFIHHHY